MKEITISINGKRYDMAAFLSVADVELVVRRFNESLDLDYKHLMSEIISAHIDRKISLSEFNKAEDYVFDLFITECLSDDGEIKAYYDTLSRRDRFERFLVAVYETRKKDIVDYKKSSLVDTLFPAIERLARSAYFMANQVAQKMNIFIESYNKFISYYNESFSGIVSFLQEFAKRVYIPTITEEEKEQRIQALIAWGKLGWTVPPNASIRTFYEVPENSKDAYSIMRQGLKKKDIEELFARIRQEKHIRKADFEEAVKCFDSRNYKACAMILFSMIDARLIRAQDDRDRNGRGMRSSGKKAAEMLHSHIKEKNKGEQLLYSILIQANTFAAIGATFDGGNDFKEQPQVINRNFVIHGMLHRRVTRKDCLMLFLLLYNFTNYMNYFV